MTSVRARAAFVAGPTASGKTSLAIEVAERVGAEIVSCDSRQIYRGMSIGTAAPTEAERARVPHHLVGVAMPSEHWSAGRWAREAAHVLSALAEKGRTILIVGGSGLYARALRRGLAELPSNRALREALDREWQDAEPWRLHARLRRLDPDVAETIHPNNRQRILRALEVCLSSGRRMSELWQEQRAPSGRFPAPMFAVRMSREALDARIDRRVEEMFAGGLLDEARALLGAGFSSESPAYRTLGYPEAIACVAGEMSPAEAISRVQRQTRAFARRQLTWLRGEPELRWIDVDAANSRDAVDTLTSIVSALEPCRLMPLDAPPHTG